MKSTTGLASTLAVAGVLALAAAAQGSSNEYPQAAPGQAGGWRLVDTWAPSFDQATLLDPTGAEYDGGALYVADTGHRRVLRLVNGVASGSIGGPAELTQPLDVAVDRARDRLYVADEGGRQIAVYTLTGGFISSWRSAGPDEAFVPYALTLDTASGDIFALSSGLVPRVERFRQDGTWVMGWGSLGLGTGQFIAPADLAVDRSGKLLVADAGSGRIQLFNLDGSSLGQWSGLLGAVAIDTDLATGRSFVLAGSTADRVVVVSPLGTIDATHVSRTLAPADQWHPGRGIALMEGEAVAVTTGFGGASGAHGVRTYETAPFAFVANWTADPRAGGGFVGPSAIDVGPSGELGVLDSPVRGTRLLAPSGLDSGWVDSGRGDELEFGPSGEMYVADLRRGVALRRLAPDGSRDWEKTCDCMSGMGLAATADRVYATDGLSRTIQIFDLVPGRDQPIGSLSRVAPPYAWPMDLAMDAAGKLWAVDAFSRTLHVIDPQGAPGLTLTLPAAGHRISIGPDGTAFVLLLDGSVAALAPDGRLIEQWPVLNDDGSAPLRPADLAAGPGGRLYVLDGQSGNILVYDRGTDPVPTPSTPAGCSAAGDKTASPGRVPLGAEVTVTLTLDIRCADGTGSDVVLILDRSSSMAGDGCNRLCEAKAAASSFVDTVDLSRHHVAVVSFADTAVLDIGLSSDRAAIQRAIDSVLPAGNTNIAGALAQAQDHLQSSGRPESQPVVLLLTDGDPSGTEQAFLDALREGIRVRERGGLLYSIGLGANVNAELLTALAGTPDRYFFAPRATDLGPIYDILAESIDAIAATELVIEDRMGPDVEYVSGSATGSPEVRPGVLIWRIGTAVPEGFSATYRVRPLVVGTVPTNELAFATYDVAGVHERYDFPVPEVEVYAPATPTPTRTATTRPTVTVPPSATPTRRPTVEARPVYLPIVRKGLCEARDRARGADVVLVIDTSASMTGEKLEAAVAAAKSFVAAVDPRRDRVGVVSFDASARLGWVLTTDHQALRAALDTMTTSPGTRIDLGVQAALKEIGYRGRAGSRPVIVLLTDGLPTAGTEELVDQATAAVRAANISMWTIGLGADADLDLLARMATGQGRYLNAPTPDDLVDVYRTVVESLPCR